VVTVALTTALAAMLGAVLSIELSVHDRATAQRDGSAVVRGILTCSAETLVSLEGQVVEFIGRSAVATGTFATDVPCSPTGTPWSVTVASDSSVPFRPGFAVAELQAVGFDPESGIFSGVQALTSLHLTRSPR
jgi:hypothetical protein